MNIPSWATYSCALEHYCNILWNIIATYSCALDCMLLHLVCSRFKLSCGHLTTTQGLNHWHIVGHIATHLSGTFMEHTSNICGIPIFIIPLSLSGSYSYSSCHCLGFPLRLHCSSRESSYVHSSSRCVPRISVSY